MDTRGQGSTWGPGATPDVVSGLGADGPAGGHHPGFVTRGVESPATWYYRRLVTDAVLAVDAVAAHPLVDAGRIAVTATARAAGSRWPSPASRLSFAPRRSTCRSCAAGGRALEITDATPIGELHALLSPPRAEEGRVFRTLSYVDGRTSRPGDGARAVLGRADGRDLPPSTVFARSTTTPGQGHQVWPFNGHEPAS
jgi:cephalosporin-C deacetylase